MIPNNTYVVRADRNGFGTAGLVCSGVGLYRADHRTATNRNRASFTRMIKSNHHHIRRQKLSPGGGRSPPSSLSGISG